MKPAGRERALELLAMRSWSKRKEGIEMLAGLGERDLMAQYAIAERDAPAVVEAAIKALHPEPVEVIRHYVAMVQGQDANLSMQYHVPSYNYLYAEAALADVYRARKGKLKPGVIEAIGLAYLREMGAEFLPRYLAPGKLAKPGAGVASVITHEALLAATALRRLDLPVDVKSLRAAVETLLEVSDPGNLDERRWHCQLEWILFDAGEHDAFEFVAELADDDGQTRSDLALTLLKRRRFEDLHWYARTRFSRDSGWQQFCYWPLQDYLERHGLSVPGDRSLYTFARKRGVAPPPWWTWL